MTTYFPTAPHHKGIQRPLVAWACALLALVSLILLPQYAGADTNLITSGSWNSAANWSNGLPTVTGSANVDSNLTVLAPANVSGTTFVLCVGNTGTGVLSISGGNIYDTGCYLGYNIGASGTATVSSGTWTTANTIFVGNSGTGTLTITGGYVVANNSSNIGKNKGAYGIATITSGTWVSTSVLSVGDAGTGTLTISGGNVSTAQAIFGDQTGAKGLVNVNGGTLQTNTLYVGNNGTGVLNIGGGTVTGTSYGYIGLYAGSSGTVSVTGGIFSNLNTLNIGVSSGATGMLSISGSGGVRTVATMLGAGAGSSGTANVTAGWWTNTGLLAVGGGGTGMLSISGSGYVSSGSSSIGYVAGASGTAVVSSGGIWSNSSSLSVGDSGRGVLTISGGAVTSSMGYVGYSGSSSGMATVSSGTWSNTYLYVGYSGTGTLTVSGGYVSDYLGYVGYSGSSTGTTTVTSGTWSNTNSCIVGNSGTGTLNLSGSGVVTIASGTGTLTLAQNAGSVGILNLGAGGTLNASVINGGRGKGTVNLNQPGDFTFTQQLTGTLSVIQSGTGTITFTGISNYGGADTVKGAFQFSQTGTSTLSCVIGGTGALIQSGPGTTTLTGSNNYGGGTTLNSGQLNINNASALGTGTFTIKGGSIDNTSGAAIALATNNAQNWNSDFTFLGSHALDLGTGAVTLGANLTVTVSGSALTVGGAISDGGNGYSLTKAGGGTLLLTGSSACTTVTVDGGILALSGSLQTINLTVGESGTGALNINGGSVKSNNGTIGSGTGSSGTTTVTSGTWANSAYLYVGNSGMGTLNIQGGTVTDSISYLGNNTGSSGTATVTSGTWNNSSALYIGGDGTGALNIQGGYVYSNNSYLGKNTGSVGTATVSSGTWSNFGSLYVGNDGKGTLNLQGGLVSDYAGYLGYNAGSSGTATITSGTWTNSARLYIGNSGTGTLNINGGTVISSLSLYGFESYIGFNIGSCGTATVTSGTWINSGNLNIGNWGTGTLTINGGLVSSSNNSYIGTVAGSKGTATVTSGTWKNAGSLIVGYSGTGTLNLSGSGVVTVGNGNGTITLAQSAGSVGTLNLGTGGAVGTLNAAAVNGGSGTATVNFNQSGSYIFDPRLSGNLSVNKLGSGTTSLTNSNTYTGATTLTGGALVLSGTGNINSSSGIIVNGSGAKFVQASSVAGTNAITLTQGTLDGTGTVGAVTVGDGTGGIVTHGIGTTAQLTMGSLTFNGAGTVNICTTGSAGIVVTGALTTGAQNASGLITLNISSPSLWMYNTTYDLIDYGSLGGQGFGSFVKGAIAGLDGGQIATLGNSGSAITLSITRDSLLWTGTQGNLWTTGTTSIWKGQTTGATTDYLTGDTVVFDDTASGSTNIKISGTNVSPASMTFNNSTKDYSITSDGGYGIATGSLVKSGTGALTIATANTYGGGTALNAGQLNINNASALGTGTFTINGGSLDNTSGAAIALAGNNAQKWDGDFTFVGSNALDMGTGAVTLGANRTVTVSASTLTIGGAIGDGGKGYSLTKVGNGTLLLTGSSNYSGNTTVDGGILANTGSLSTSALYVGTSGTGGLNINGGTVTSGSGIIGSGASGNGTATVTSGTWVNSNDLYVGSSSGTGTLNINGGAVTDCNANISRNGNGAVIMSSGTWTNSGAILFGNGGTGNLTMSGGTITDHSATLGVWAGDCTANVTGGTWITSGTGSFFLLGNSGNGTLNLEGGTVTCSGPFVISNNASSTGVLNLGTGGTVGTLNVAAVDGGAGAATVNFNHTGDYTFDPQLTGNLSVNKLGSGTTTLTGSNTYTGGTTLNEGQLNLNNASAIGTGTFTINGGSINNTSGAVIASAGNNAQKWNGDFTFVGSNALDMGKGAVTLSASRTVTVNASTLTVGGAIGDGGNGYGLTKSGTGTLNLTGTNTYTGLTTVQNGALLVNGSIASDVTVWNGGLLGGSGHIGGNVTNQGVISPGNSPGTLIIAGNYTQTSTGILLVQIASSTVYDRLLIGGTATLSGTLQVSFLNGFVPNKGEAFTYITGTGGVIGAFTKIETDSLIKLQAQYLATNGTLGIPLDVILTAFQGSFAEDVPGLTPNQRAVAKGLDKVVDRSRVASLVEYLDGFPLAEIPQKLEKIVPTDLIPMFDASINSANVQADNLERRMEEIRSGAMGFSASGLNLSDSHGSRSFNGNADGKQAIGKDGKELAPAPISDRWGFFINGSGEFVDEESTAIARGTNFTTSGITTGADYRLGDHAAVGVTAGYANTSASGRGDGPVKIGSGKLGLYGTVFDRGFFLNSAVGGGLNSYDTQRDTLGGLARGDANGTDFNALLGTGYTYRKGGLSVGPIASARYSWAGIDAFTERGSMAPLRISSQSEDSLKSTAGLQTSYAFQIGKIALTPQLRAQWQHECLSTSRGIGASFLPGGAFTVNGPEIGRDSLLLDAGLTVQLTLRVGVYCFYTGDLGRQNYTSHSINGGVQWSF